MVVKRMTVVMEAIKTINARRPSRLKAIKKLKEEEIEKSESTEA